MQNDWCSAFLQDENSKLRAKVKMLHEANMQLATKMAEVIKESLIKEEAIRGMAERIEHLETKQAPDLQDVRVPLCTEATRQYMRIASFH